MNKSKSLILMLVCGLCTAFLTTSCLETNTDDSNYSNLTRSDSIASMSAVSGSYTGKLVYNIPATSTTQASKDSVNCNWTVSSTYQTYGTITVTDFPVSAIAPFLQGTSSTTTAKEILATASTQPLTMYIIPYTTTAYTSGYYYMYSLYMDKTLSFNTEYNGSSHKVEIQFALAMNSSSSSYDSYDSSGYIYAIAAKYLGQMQGNILVHSVTIDGTEHSVRTYFYFHN